MRVTFFFVAFVATLIIVAGVKKQKDKRGPTTIVHETGSEKFKIRTTSEENGIIFCLEVDGIPKGWIGIGVNTAQNMVGADMGVLMFSGSSSYSEMRDMQPTGNDVPVSHNTHTWQFLNQTNTSKDKSKPYLKDQVKVYISRPYKSGDEEFSGTHIKNQPLYIIWAYKPMTLFVKHDPEERGHTTKAEILNPFYSSGESITGRITLLVFAFVIVQSNFL